MKQFIVTFKKLYASESVTDEQRKQIILSVDRLFEAGKITEDEKKYILGKEE